MNRGQVRPFSEREIALVETFASAAAIALSNSNLFSDLRTRTAELSRSLDELRALSEVGRAVSSTLDLETVLVESPGGTGPFAAKAIGEMANNSPPAAIANAVADAVGARLFELPITAERVLAALTPHPARSDKSDLRRPPPQGGRRIVPSPLEGEG